MQSTLSAKDTVNSPGAGYDIVVRRPSDGFYHDFDDDTFKAYADVTTLRVTMSEDADVPGIWTATFTVDATFTGQADVTFLETPADLIHDSRRVAFKTGTPLVDLARPEVLVGTHTGGFETLKVVDELGEAVESAVIRVYAQADFDADDLDSNIIGMTATDSRGYWNAPVPVAAGGSYVVHVHKAFGVGPSTTTISV